MENNEKHLHLFAQKKMFDLITTRRVSLFNSTDYQELNIYTGIYNNDEFLHMNGIGLCYGGFSIFSNPDLPCKELRKKVDNWESKCNDVVLYGAWDSVPCYECIRQNFNVFRFFNGSLDNFLGYNADIMFGIRGMFRDWIDIGGLSKHNRYKIEYCKKNNIRLFNVAASVVMNFDYFNYNDHLFLKRIV